MRNLPVGHSRQWLFEVAIIAIKPNQLPWCLLSLLVICEICVIYGYNPRP